MRRAERLRQRREFAAVYRHGRAYRSDLFVLRALRTDEPLARFGFTASKALGGAVVRNRVKRRLREAARALPVAPGWDVVLNGRRRAAEVEFSRVLDTMRELMARAKMLEASE